MTIPEEAPTEKTKTLSKKSIVYIMASYRNHRFLPGLHGISCQQCIKYMNQLGLRIV